MKAMVVSFMNPRRTSWPELMESTSRPCTTRRPYICSRAYSASV